MRYTSTILSFTATASPAIDALTPITHLSDRELASLAIKSTSTAAQQITLDLGSQKTIDVICLHFANFNAVQIQSAPDTTTFAAISGSPFTIQQDHVGNGYGKLFVVVSLVNTRSIRLTIPLNTPTFDGATVYTLGLVSLCQSLVTLTRDAAPEIEYTEVTPSSEMGGIRRGQQVIHGPSSMDIGVRGSWQIGTEIDAVARFINTARKTPVVALFGDDTDMQGKRVFIVSALPNNTTYTDERYSYNANYRLKELV